MRFNKWALMRWDAERACAYCKGRFTPDRPQDARMRFCSKECKDKFWRHGSVPMAKFMLRIEAQINRIIDGYEGRVAKLEKELKDIKQANRAGKKKRNGVVAEGAEVCGRAGGGHASEVPLLPDEADQDRDHNDAT